MGCYSREGEEVQQTRVVIILVVMSLLVSCGSDDIVTEEKDSNTFALSTNLLEEIVHPDVRK